MDHGALKTLNAYLALGIISGISCAALLLAPPSQAQGIDSNQQNFLNIVKSKSRDGDPKSVVATLNQRLAYETKDRPIKNTDFVFDLLNLKLELASRRSDDALLTATVNDIKKVLPTAKEDTQGEFVQKLLKSSVITLKPMGASLEVEAFRRRAKLATLDGLLEQCSATSPKCPAFFPIGYALHSELRTLQDNEGLIKLLKPLLKMAEEMSDAQKQFDFHRRLAYAQRKAGELDAATKSLDKAEKFVESAPGGKNEGQVSLLSERAFIASLKKEFDQADKFITTALTLEGIDPETRYYVDLERPKILHYRGQPEAALKLIDPLLALQKKAFTDHPRGKHALFWTVQFAGLVHAQAGDATKAYQTLKTAYELSSDNPHLRTWARLYFALAAAGVGKTNEAEEAVKAAQSDIKYLATAIGQTADLDKTARAVSDLISAKDPDKIRADKEKLIKLVDSYSANDLPTSLAIQVLTSNIKVAAAPSGPK